MTLCGVSVPVIPSFLSHDNCIAWGIFFVHDVHITPFLVGVSAGRMLVRFLTGVVRSGECLFSRRFFRRLRPGVFFHPDKVVGSGDNVWHEPRRVPVEVGSKW